VSKLKRCKEGTSRLKEERNGIRDYRNEESKEI